MASLRDVVAAESLGTKGMDEAAASRRFFAIVGAVVAKRASGVMYCGLTDRTVEFDEHGEVELLAGAALRGGATDFLSPEQLRNVKSTAASDVWALGVLLWHMLDGSLPAIPFGLQREMEPPFTNNIPHSPSLRRLLRACLLACTSAGVACSGSPAWRPPTPREHGAGHQRGQRLQSALAACTVAGASLPRALFPPLARGLCTLHLNDAIGAWHILEGGIRPLGRPLAPLATHLQRVVPPGPEPLSRTLRTRRPGEHKAEGGGAWNRCSLSP